MPSRNWIVYSISVYVRVWVELSMHMIMSSGNNTVDIVSCNFTGFTLGCSAASSCQLGYHGVSTISSNLISMIQAIVESWLAR